MTPAQAIDALRKRGKTDKEIGLLVESHQSTIGRIRKGLVPNWFLGQKLVALAMLPDMANTSLRSN